MTFKKHAKQLWWVLRFLTPRGRWGDVILGGILFAAFHKRLPSRRAMIFNDVLYRMKLVGELAHPIRVFTSDKDLLKTYVAGIAGAEYNVPTLAVLRSRRDIESYDFPDNCVIKPTHASGKVIIRRNGAAIDKDEVISWLSFDYYKRVREENYATLPPKIIIEPIIFDDIKTEGGLIDYKIFCFHGRAKFIQIDRDRHTRHTRLLYDLNWTSLGATIAYPMAKDITPKPKRLDDMIALAEKLAQGLSLVRIDLYTDDKAIMVGEITHCHGATTEKFDPPHKEQEISALLFGNETMIKSDVPQSNPKTF